VDKIVAAHDLIHTRYGSLQIHQELRGQGFRVSRRRVARIMKKNVLHATSRRRFKRIKLTGIQAIAANHLDRQFCPIRPDLDWAGDITYIDTTDGWRYRAVWMDLHSRRHIGWALGETLESSLVTEALEHAFGCRSVNLDELMIYTDQGSQYTSKEFKKRLVDKEITCGMSRKGNCWENAVVESFFETLKDELEILAGLIRDPEQLLCDLWMWTEGYYNRKCLHSSIGYSAPVAFEDRQAERDKIALKVGRDLSIELRQPQTFLCSTYSLSHSLIACMILLWSIQAQFSQSPIYDRVAIMKYLLVPYQSNKISEINGQRQFACLP
jgi:putative transposase